MNYKHGKAKKSLAYNSWMMMKQRCLNEKCKKYPLYGGRGIKICEEWMDFRNFIKDMGERSSNQSLGRINNDGNYEAENCRWENQKTQQNNRSNNTLYLYKGLYRPIKYWSELSGIKVSTLKSRIFLYNMNIKEAIETPVRKNKK